MFIKCRVFCSFAFLLFFATAPSVGQSDVEEQGKLQCFKTLGKEACGSYLKLLDNMDDSSPKREELYNFSKDICWLHPQKTAPLCNIAATVLSSRQTKSTATHLELILLYSESCRQDEEYCETFIEYIETLEQYNLPVQEAPRDQARLFLKSLCALTDDSEVCTRYAFWEVSELKPDLKQATIILQQSCDAQYTNACIYEAEAKMFGQIGAERVPVVGPAVEHECNRGNPVACFNLGKIAEASSSIDISSEVKADIYARACELGDYRACVRIEYLAKGKPCFDNTKLCGANPEIAEKYLRVGCDYWNGNGACSSLARLYQQSNQIEKMFEAYAWACGTSTNRPLEQRSGFDCYNIAKKFYDGTEIQQNLHQSRFYAEEACTLNRAEGCILQAEITAKGYPGFPGDRQKALQLYKLGCIENYSRIGCEKAVNFSELNSDYKNALIFQKKMVKHEINNMFNVVMHTAAGRSEQNKALKSKENSIAQKIAEQDSRKRLKHLCDNGNYAACASLGYSYDQGKGGLSVNKLLARELYEKACRGNSFIGCGNLALHYQYGYGGLPKSKQKALSFYKKACDGGYEKSCKNLASLSKRESSKQVASNQNCIKIETSNSNPVGVETFADGTAQVYIKDEAGFYRVYTNTCDTPQKVKIGKDNYSNDYRTAHLLVTYKPTTVTIEPKQKVVAKCFKSYVEGLFGGAKLAASICYSR